MDPKKNAPKLDVDYFAFEGNEFYEWVDTAPTSNLVEAICEYFKVLEYSSKFIDSDADFTNRYFLNELNGVAWNFYELGPWIMHIQHVLNQRAAPNRSKKSLKLRTESGQ